MAGARALLRANRLQAAADLRPATYTADTLTIDCDGPHFRIEDGPWAGRRLHDLYEWAQTPWDWHEAMFDRARSLGLSIFSTPFDPTSVAFLERFDPPAYKVASFELVDLPLIEHVAATGRPLILSTGLASAAEIDDAIAAAVRGIGTARGETRHREEAQIILLHCVSGYPSAPEEARLAAMAELAARTKRAVGLSDHSLGTAVAVAATALGAVMIEKHLTLKRAEGGPDAAFSLEPDELATLCRDCRTAWRAADGMQNEGRAQSERASAIFRRSLFIVEDIRSGEPFTATNTRSIRPGNGLPPKHLPEVLGRRATRAIRRGTPLAWDMVSA